MPHNSIMRLLGIDYGKKRVGIATSDEEGRIAFPYQTLANNADLVKRIVEISKQEKVEAIVVGESLDYSGKENPLMKHIRSFKKALSLSVDIPIFFEPEVLTSAEARRSRYGRRVLDASAAALILQSFIDKKREIPKEASKGGSENRKSVIEKLHMLKIRWRDWFVHRADSPHAQSWLAFFSFTESLIFPIPPDVLLIAMTIARSARWFWFFLITTIASLLGGIFAYFIGLFFFETVGKEIIAFYNWERELLRIAELYNGNAFFAVFVGAFTLIPYKIFTLSAGFFSINFFVFVAASLVGRGLRYFAVSYIAKRYGRALGSFIFKRFNLLTFAIVILLLLLLLGVR